VLLPAPMRCSMRTNHPRRVGVETVKLAILCAHDRIAGPDLGGVRISIVQVLQNRLFCRAMVMLSPWMGMSRTHASRSLRVFACSGRYTPFTFSRRKAVFMITR